MNEGEIRELIEQDSARMSILRAVKALELSDWWIGAGFLRNAVWDKVFGNGTQTPLNDVDVVYWKNLSSYGIPVAQLEEDISANRQNPVWEEESMLVSILQRQIPEYTFEVKNQARMHLFTASDVTRKPYATAADGIADWTETATCVGVKLNDCDELELLFTHGIEDLVNGVIRPTQSALEARVLERATTKSWLSLWPGLRFEEAL